MSLLLVRRVKFASQTDSVVAQVSSKYCKILFIMPLNFDRQPIYWIILNALLNKITILLECEASYDCDGVWTRCTNGLCSEFK